MANTYIKIASVTVGVSGASDITFSSIPGTYDDLVIKFSGRSTTTDVDTRIIFNAITTNYSRRSFGADGSVANAGSASDSWIGSLALSTYTADTFSSFDIYIPNYAGNRNKSYSCEQTAENNGTSTRMNIIAGLWSNTAAITSIKLEALSGSFTMTQYSTAVLYGISRT